MRYRSKKKEKEYRERRPLVAKLLAERPWCEACPVLAGYFEQVTYNRRQSVDIHEIVNRSQGGSILHEENLLAVCRPCHSWITSHPAEGTRTGLHLPGYCLGWIEAFIAAEIVRNNWTLGEPSAEDWLIELDKPAE